MAIGLFMEFKGIGAAKYDAIMQETGLTGDKGWWPPGLLSHYAGRTTEGWCVVDVWHSQKSFDAYLSGRLGPALTRIDGVPRPRVTPFTVHNHYKQW